MLSYNLLQRQGHYKVKCFIAYVYVMNNISRYNAGKVFMIVVMFFLDPSLERLQSSGYGSVEEFHDDISESTGEEKCMNLCNYIQTSF